MTPPNLEAHKFYIVIPKEATNQYPNPRFDGPDYGADLTDTGLGYSSAKTATYQRRGSYCMDITTASETEGGVYYSGLTVVNGTNYVFSCDIKGKLGESFTISIRDAGANIEGSTAFTATGEWQRVECTATADETVATWRIHVLRNASVTGTNHFYIDGLQFEEGTKATTFIHGYAGDGYYWDGSARNSDSIRTDKTGMGGELLDISDYAILSGIYGLGMGKYIQVMTQMANGGALYQKMIRSPRMFSIKLDYTGSMSEITEKRNTILDAVRPDLLPGQKRMIRYQGFDNSGDEATNPVDIICVPQSSHNDPATECAFNQDVLTFTVPSGLLQGAYQEGAELDIYDELAVECIVSRDEDGNWDNMDGGIDNNTVRCMAEAPNGDIYIGGDFTSVNSVANTGYLAKWDGNDWSSVTGADTFNAVVYCLCFDADGNLYIGGNFTDVGDNDGDGIVKWDGTNLSSLGTGTSAAVYDIIVDPNTGYIYVGGEFLSIGGVANTVYIAYWDGSAWKAMDTGLNDAVFALAFAPDGNLYIGGEFTNADGANGDYLCYWDGTAFNMVGNDEVAASIGVMPEIWEMKFDNGGNLYIGGSFANIGGNTDFRRLAKWNGTFWSSIGSLDDAVSSLFIDKINKIYIGGAFTEAGGLSLAEAIAVYRNGSWGMLDIDLPGSPVVYSFLIDSKDNLYIGGSFSTTADGNAVTGKVASNLSSSSASANSYPFIQFWGPGVLQSIINYSTGKEIQFDGLTLQAGEWINMICNPHKIKFESGWAARGNLLRYVIPGSDIADFYLKPGTNYISVLMPSGTTSNSAGMIAWTPRFWSIEGAKYD